MKNLKDWLVLAAVVVVSSAALWIPLGAETVYENFDGPYYLVVAKSWYDKEIIRSNFSFPLPLEYYPAHFPMYPLLARLVSLAGLDLPRSMIVVNVAATIAVAMVLYKIAREAGWGKIAIWMPLVWLFWWPRVWAVRSVGSPETLFILGLVGSLYFFQKKKYWGAGLMGAAAVLTKSPGILLFIAYCSSFIADYIKARRLNWSIYPVMLIPLALVGLFGFYWLQTGDFWAYFNSGDNIHLQPVPFRVFDSSQAWVGDFWLEDVLWIYLLGAVGVWQAFKKNPLWGWFGAVFYATILFVSHRDISRYALPLVPVILLGMEPVLARKEIRWLLALSVIPLYFYSLNFMAHNLVQISDWKPLL